MTETPARYFPYRLAPGATRIEQCPGDTDRADQAAAARLRKTQIYANRLVYLLGFGSLAAFYFLSAQPAPIIAAVGLLCGGTTLWMNRLADRAGDDSRLADATIGFPVPDTLVDELRAAGDTACELDRALAAGQTDPAVAGEIRRVRSELDSLDRLTGRSLQQLRRYWLAGDHTSWQSEARSLHILSRKLKLILLTTNAATK
jgi:hypothetical protein